MSSKKLKILAGSMRKPQFQYVTAASITHYPYNNDFGKHFNKKFIELCTKFDKKKIQETFVWRNEIIRHRDRTKNHTMEIAFLDGSKHTFDYTHATWEVFLEWIKWKNEALEGQRNLDGFDDEPDDEI